MNSQQILSDLRSRIAAKRGQGVYRRLAAVSGGELSYSWVAAFAQGANDNPTIKKVEALQCALDRIESA